MKFYHLTVVLFVFSCFSASAQPEAVAVTNHYEFYSNFWIKQHHFLYKVAGWVKKEKLNQAAEHPVFAKFKPREKAVVNNCIQHYLDNMLGKDLLFNDEMHNLKRSLIQYQQEDKLDKTAIDSSLVEVLHAFQPLYANYFWESHQQRNLEKLNTNLARIKRFEKPVFEQLAKLAQDKWPEGKIRIDLTYYANWAGAYTSNKPTHAVISTHQEEVEGSWVETVFHESAHSIIHSRRGTIAALIKDVSEKLEKESPRGLWHSVQFYLVGRIVQDLLQAEGVTYEQFMIRENVFDGHHAALKKWLEPYFQGKSTLEEAIKHLVSEL